jgi:hypothetical protein
MSVRYPKRTLAVIWVDRRPIVAELICKACREPYRAGHICPSVKP